MKYEAMSPVDALLGLIEQWVGAEFPIGTRDIPSLNSMWLSLARGLCGLHGAGMADFEREVAELRPPETAGDPPTRALKKRLTEIIDAGVRDLFLVICVREAIGQLIAARAPDSLASWVELADKALPVELRFAFRMGEVPESPHRFGPGAQSESS